MPANGKWDLIRRLKFNPYRHYKNASEMKPLSPWGKNQ